MPSRTPMPVDTEYCTLLRNLVSEARCLVPTTCYQGCGAETQILGSGSRHLKFLAPTPAPEWFVQLKTKTHCFICTNHLPSKLCLLNGNPNFRLEPSKIAWALAPQAATIDNYQCCGYHNVCTCCSRSVMQQQASSCDPWFRPFK